LADPRPQAVRTVAGDRRDEREHEHARLTSGPPYQTSTLPGEQSPATSNSTTASAVPGTNAAPTAPSPPACQKAVRRMAVARTRTHPFDERGHHRHEEQLRDAPFQIDHASAPTMAAAATIAAPGFLVRRTTAR
jgi:hypothetical protein